MKYDFIIVGAGLAGCILAERIATQLDKKVLIIDRRNHIGGNCYDFKEESGILIHKYGPHIFHTNNKKVWDYLSAFTEWDIYFHKVLGVLEGKKVPVPFNLNSIESVFPGNLAGILEEKLLNKYGYGMKIPILKLMENDDADLNFLANYIYKNIFLGYTVKQWGLKPEELDYSVTSRIPVFISKDDRYFQDSYQGIPKKGYTNMVTNMLNHKNIEIILNEDYKNIKKSVSYDKVIFTGPIDEFFDYSFGELPYRSLSFKFDTFNTDFFQETAQVNYPNNYDFTRITEFKHFYKFYKNEFSTIGYEYPEEFKKGVNEPYYPIPKKENDDLYKKYYDETLKLEGKVWFVGRLAEYKYYNMDQIAGVSLQLFEKKLAAK